MTGKALVLLYHLDPDTEKGQAVRNVLRIMKMPGRTITGEQLNQTVGYCAGIKGFEQQPGIYEGPARAEEMIIMKDLYDEQINQLLDGLRKAGAGRSALKCVVTPSNQGWPLIDLMHELRSEHEIMQAREQLYRQVQQGDTLLQALQAPRPIAGSGQIPAGSIEQDTQELAAALQRGRAILQQRQPPDLPVINAARTGLQEAVANLQAKLQAVD